MADYLSLEDAAKKLGIATDKLVDMRSQGEIRGFRDGASWKFPETEISRLADELGVDVGGAAGAAIDAVDEGFGSGILIDEGDLGSSIGSGINVGSSGSIIGGDGTSDAPGSDLGIGGETPKPGSSGGSDVNLVADLGDGSDVALVASDSSIAMSDLSDELLIDDNDPLPEIDSKELRLEDPAILHDSDDEIDLGLVAQDGSTGPVIDTSDIVSDKGSTGPTLDDSISSIELGAEPEDELSDSPEGDLSFTGSLPPEDDSGELLLGEDSSGMDALDSDILADSDIGSRSSTSASSLEMMDELDSPAGGKSGIGIHGSSGVDVLSELDLLSADSGGSGLISGDSANLLASSGLGSSLGDDVLGGIDDALADDDDLVIADDDDDLVIDSSGTDISVAGDSGINLMSPSDSGLSLESEPLDLAGSSISALDLGAELGSDPSGSGIEAGIADDASGSMVDFQADEEFQLSPSGVGLEADFDSGSQVIEVEDSEAIGEAVEFADVEEAPMAEAFATDEAGFAEAEAVEEDADDAGAAAGLDTTAARRSTAIPTPGASAGYEIPFSLMQCLALLSILAVLTLGGMLMTDLVRNMWAYNDSAAPVSSLTNALIDLMGW